ncbi:hypothetical protein E2C01_046384 [Portunus trituberculatus]|uniref:Uncharacterized protein n=1 Tax=Portunus trituberculatus TaxID=210409 RepID=A0A5B7G7M6_PORTR|nr:hypothetical protein [Portunus trituberculatus]
MNSRWQLPTHLGDGIAHCISTTYHHNLFSLSQWSSHFCSNLRENSSILGLHLYSYAQIPYYSNPRMS